MLSEQVNAIAGQTNLLALGFTTIEKAARAGRYPGRGFAEQKLRRL